jgi:hypothetical protein
MEIQTEYARIVVAGGALQFLQSLLLNQAFGAYFAVLVEERGWSKTALSGAAALKSTEAALLGPVLGWMVDRDERGRRSVICPDCTRAALMEAAHVLGDVAPFNDVEQFSKRAVSDRIAREALAAGVAQERVETVEEDGKVTKKTKKRSIDVAALRLAGEHVDPHTHGKLARAGEDSHGASVTVQVVGTVILAAPPPLGED